MNEAAPNFELLLRRALAPVDPPDDLVQRMEATLTSLTEIAAEELELWELSSMRDPRNWARPAAALVVGSAAGAALVVLRARQHATARRASASARGARARAGARGARARAAAGARGAATGTSVRQTASRALADAASEARKLLGRL